VFALFVIVLCPVPNVACVIGLFILGRPFLSHQRSYKMDDQTRFIFHFEQVQ